MFPCYRYLCCSPQLGAFLQEPKQPYLLAFIPRRWGIVPGPVLPHPGPRLTPRAQPVSDSPGDRCFPFFPPRFSLRRPIPARLPIIPSDSILGGHRKWSYANQYVRVGRETANFICVITVIIILLSY